MNTQHISLFELVTRPHLLATGLRLLGRRFKRWLKSKSGWWYAAAIVAMLIVAGIGYCLYMAVTEAMNTALPLPRQMFGAALLALAVASLAAFVVGLRRNPNKPQ